MAGLANHIQIAVRTVGQPPETIKAQVARFRCYLPLCKDFNKVAGLLVIAEHLIPVITADQKIGRMYTADHHDSAIERYYLLIYFFHITPRFLVWVLCCDTG